MDQARRRLLERWRHDLEESELGPRPGLGAPVADAPTAFSPEDIAATLAFPAGQTDLPAEPVEEAAPVTQPLPEAEPPASDETMRLVESIMPRVAPESLKAEDITNPNLKAELEAFQAAQAPAEAARPSAIEPPIDPGETIKLFDPRKSS